MTGVALRVLVADDQRVVRDGLATVLSTMAGIEVVGAATDGAEAIAMAGALHPDVVLMDLRMPGTDGVAAIRSLRADQPDAAVVVLTTYYDDESIVDAMRAGAVGYLTKNAGPDDIRRALDAAVAGQATLDPLVAARLVEAAAEGAGRATPGGPGAAPLPDGLSPREGEVLALVAAGLSNTEIAAALYVSVSTVKTHVNQIFAKTGSRDRPQAMTYALRHGITPAPDALSPPPPRGARWPR